jgi:NCS1 family nucleobase:cation symporter-1
VTQVRQEPDESTYEAFKVEQHGIDLISPTERGMKPANLFWLWAGAIWNIEFLVYGALIMSFGLSFKQAVLAIVIGNVSYAFLGLASLQGPTTGTTALMVSRAPFGRNGNRLVAFFNWLTQVGFEVEGLALIVIVVEKMFTRGGIHPTDGLKALVIVIAVLAQFIVPFLGHATITTVLRWLSVVFIAVFAVMTVLVTPHMHLSHFSHPSSGAVWTTALVLIISAGGLGWTENANDYSRYLPVDTPKSRTFWAATLGSAIPSILLELLGAAAFAASSGVQHAGSSTAGILDALPTSFSSWFFWPFLILCLPQLLAINTLDLYSSGVTLQAMGVPVKRWGAVIIDTVVAGAVTAVVIFTGNFYNDLSDFLNYIVVWLAPWFGIVLVDYLLRRGVYDPLSLVQPRGGVYWRQGGVNWKAVVALVVGGVASLMWIDALYYNPSYIGPFSSRTNGSDLSWLIGIVVGAVLYAALSWSSVRREVEQAPLRETASARG